MKFSCSIREWLFKATDCNSRFMPSDTSLTTSTRCLFKKTEIKDPLYILKLHLATFTPGATNTNISGGTQEGLEHLFFYTNLQSLIIQINHLFKILLEFCSLQCLLFLIGPKDRSAEWFTTYSISHVILTGSMSIHFIEQCAHQGILDKNPTLKNIRHLLFKIWTRPCHKLPRSEVKL